MSLAAATETFAEANEHLATTEGAKGRCHAASAAFLNFLLAEGIITLDGRGTEWSNAEIAVIDGVSHYAARVGDVYFDWTARQFNPHAPFPEINAW